MFRRVIEVIEMQNNPDAWTRKYDDLVQAKIDRLRSLSPKALSDLRAQWTALVGEIRSALTEDPKSQKAQDLAIRWTKLLENLMGKPISAGELGRHHNSQEWTAQMATFVDKPI